MCPISRISCLTLVLTALSSTPAAAQDCPPGWDGASGQTNLGNDVRGLCVFDDGTGAAVYVGGYFAIRSRPDIRFIARWDGRSFSAVGGGLSNSVEDLCVFDNGSGPALYATGFFSSADGRVVNHIAKWDGERWSSLAGGLPGTFAEGVALTVFDDGRGPALYVGGAFGMAGPVQANGIARWDGQMWEALTTGLSGVCYSLAVFDDGRGPGLYVGGDFLRAGGVTVNNIARWNGTSWSALGAGITHTGVGGALALAVFDDGTGNVLCVGGRFTHAGGIPAGNLVRWNGSAWSVIEPGANNPVYSLATYADQHGLNLYAGGAFSSIGGVTASGVARWDGRNWSPLDQGVVYEGGCCTAVRAFAAYDADPHGPSLYIGGNFDHAGGLPANNLARWGCAFQTGDTNCDGSLNVFDIQPFVLAVQDVGEYARTWPGCFLDRADANLDGSVNMFDVQAFVDLLSP